MTPGTEVVPLADKVDFLGAAKSYPAERPDVVQARETHMSWVFLTGRFAYKLKKPVRHTHVDLRALDARRRNCLTEIRLNRRLAPDVYLAVKPLTFAAHRGLQIAGDGSAVEWLVVMRRLPDGLMLDHALRSGGPDRRDLDRVALRLARFYSGLAPDPVSPAVRRRWFEEEIRLSRQELARPAFSRDVDLVDRAAGRLIDFLGARPEVLIERQRAGHIVEGHGDLRPEHICLERDPVIIDGLEFSRRLRLVELQRNGAMEAANLPAMLTGTVTLALAANAYELLCTAGFPLVFTRILTLSDLSTTAYYGYLTLYNLVYVLPLLAIVVVFVVTLGARKLKEGEGRVLKLLSGLMMLGLGMVLLVAPEALSYPLTALALIVGALIMTALVVWFAREATSRAAR